MSAKDVQGEILDPVVEDSGDLAKLVDQVAEGHAPIVVARAGEPKAALVSMEDYARLKEVSVSKERKSSLDEWVAKSREFQQSMRARRGGQPLDQGVVDQARREAREELENRDSRHAGIGC